MREFGGKWTEEKLDSFIDYVKAYITIFRKQKTKHPWITIYFDGFAGIGHRIIKSKIIPLFEGDISRLEDYNIYSGSVRKILDIHDSYNFDWYYFIDKSRKYTKEL